MPYFVEVTRQDMCVSWLLVIEWQGPAQMCCRYSVSVCFHVAVHHW